MVALPTSRSISIHKGVNQRSKYVAQVLQQRPESPTVTLTWHACKYKVYKLHQRYILKLLVYLVDHFHSQLLLLLLKCCFTSTETVGLLGMGALDVHLDFHTAPELFPFTPACPGLYIKRTLRRWVWNIHNVHLSCAHQRPERSHDTY